MMPAHCFIMNTTQTATPSLKVNKLPTGSWWNDDQKLHSLRSM